MPGTNGVPTGMSGREVKSGGGRRSGGGGGGGGDEEGRASSRKGADQRNSAHRGGGAAQRHPTEARQVTPQKFYFFPRPTRGHNQIPLLLNSCSICSIVPIQTCMGPRPDFSQSVSIPRHSAEFAVLDDDLWPTSHVIVQCPCPPIAGYTVLSYWYRYCRASKYIFTACMVVVGWATCRGSP